MNGQEKIEAAKDQEAWKLYAETGHGVLATLSVDVPGYPFGSVVPYVLDKSGQAVMLMSHLAQHFKNARKNPKASFTILAEGERDIQKRSRLTYLGDLVPVESNDEDTRRRFNTRYPDSKDFEAKLGFQFFRLRPVKLRFIGGFGQAKWIDPKNFFSKRVGTASSHDLY
jgi:heme iron utilization protein